MKQPQWIIGVGLLALLPVVPALAEQGQGQAIVTVLPKHDGEVQADLVKGNFSVKVNGKTARITQWAPLQQPGDRLELVVLIDSAARTSLGGELGTLTGFLRELPPNVKVSIGYMINGRAALAGPLSADRDQLQKQVHLPVGSAGSNSSPYFCLSDLAKNWPSRDPKARREVVMITDGVDYYHLRYDPNDPYVMAAINDSIRARMVVYSIYWMNQGRLDRSVYENNAGQNLLAQVTDATGGKSFWQGMGNPVSFQPYLNELDRRLKNQYELRFETESNGKPEILPLKLKFKAPGTEVDAPGEVLVLPVAQAKGE